MAKGVLTSQLVLRVLFDTVLRMSVGYITNSVLVMLVELCHFTGVMEQNAHAICDKVSTGI